MGLITSAGIGSGIDLESIIDALITAERQPKLSSLNRLEDRTNSTLSGLGQLQSSLSSLEDTLGNLTESSFKARTAASSDSSQISASANFLASETSFDVTIDQKAQIAQQSSAVIAGDSSTVLGAGNLTFDSTAGDTFQVGVLAGDSLADIVSRINNKSDNFGISATLVNGDTGTKIVYRSLNTGDNANFTVTNDNANLAAISDGNGGALIEDQAAQGGQITIEGLTISSDTNSFSNPVQGVDLTIANSATLGSTITIDVDKDKETVKANIEKFVEDYNAFLTTANQLGSAEEGAEGVLLGDSTLRNIVRSVSSQVSNTVASSNPDFNTLSRIGITTNRDGTLSVNSSELDNLLENNFDAIGNVFYAADGVGTAIAEVITPYEQVAGFIDKREESLQTILSQIATDRANLDFRISSLEESLRAKFAAVDSLVSQFNFTGSFLEQQFASLSGNQQGN